MSNHDMQAPRGTQQPQGVGLRTNMFNPSANPNATMSGFQRPVSNHGSVVDSTAGASQHYNHPSIGASLMDQEAVSLTGNLQGKKKKKKKSKMAGGANGFLGGSAYQPNIGALANAGNAIGGTLEPQKRNIDALPDLDLDVNNIGDAEDDADFNAFNGAKINRQPQDSG